METKVEKYPSFLEFASRYPPDGVQLRDLLNKAAHSPLQEVSEGYVCLECECGEWRDRLLRLGQLYKAIPDCPCG